MTGGCKVYLYFRVKDMYVYCSVVVCSIKDVACFSHYKVSRLVMFLCLVVKCCFWRKYNEERYACGYFGCIKK